MRMVSGSGMRILAGWTLTLLAVSAGCGDRTGTVEPAAPDGAAILAVVNGTPVTQREVDEALGPQLQDLDRARYDLRLKRLEQMIAARVVGEERAQRDPERAFRAAATQANVEVRLQPPAAIASGADASEIAVSEGAADGATARRSALPLTLVGTVVRDNPQKSMAAVRVPGALLARNVHPGQPVVDGAVLLRVERNRIIIRHQGALEFIPLSVTNEASTPTPVRNGSRYARTPDAELSLRRSDVDRALRDVPALERSLTRAAPEIDGRRLLVLETVEPGGLYDLLQLQERDVLMQVNGEWVDDRRNPLWDALRADGPVTLLVMRAGQPQAFAYEIN